jgi:hypothetical protein
MRWFSDDEIAEVMHAHDVQCWGYVYTDRAGRVHGVPGLRDKSFILAVNFAARQMATATRVGSPGRGIGSYPLKHRIERTWCHAPGSSWHGYVPNGAVIVAAHLLGIGIWREWWQGPNATIGISKRYAFPVAGVEPGKLPAGSLSEFLTKRKALSWRQPAL